EGTGKRVGRGGKGRRPREGNDERVEDLNGQGNDQGLGANGGCRVSQWECRGSQWGAPDFLMIIAQQLQNLLPAMLAKVSNRGNVGNQNSNVVNKNVQENVGNALVNGNRVGCSYKEFLACNPKEYDGKGGAVVLTRWIEKMENIQDMSGCSNDQKVKYTAGSFMGKTLTWWNSQIRTLSREVAVKSELWNHAMVGAGHAVYTNRFHKLARKGDYDILEHEMRLLNMTTDHNLWDVIVNGDLEEEPAPTGETSAPPAPKTAKQLAARRNQERVKSILLLAIPDEYLPSFTMLQMLNHSGRQSN
ncbi:hypothetical protein Tco_1075723, partial [Tanacetum coccineum]